MCEALAAGVDVDTDSFPQHQLHVGRVAELNDHSNRQVDALLGPQPPSTEEGTLVDSRVPRCLCFHLKVHQIHYNKSTEWKYSPFEAALYLSIVVFDNLQVEEVVLIFFTQSGVQASRLRHLELVLRAEVISWGSNKTYFKVKGLDRNMCIMPQSETFLTFDVQENNRNVCLHAWQRRPVSKDCFFKQSLGLLHLCAFKRYK